MAAIRGNLGVMEFGAAGVAALTSYTLDTTQDTAETSAMGATGRTYISTMHGFSGSADFILEGGAEAPQFDTIAALDVASADGSAVLFELYPETSGSGNIKYSGSAIITGASYTASFDGTVTGSLTFQGTGTLSSSIAS
tara:strand:- start:85 stop:501 length:417 start_codon:yes stop_codon:yes gene_type:complete